jgi:hypothetical protein
MTGADLFEVADWAALPRAPRVSVYMLAYRHERFLGQAIIGEDASPDRSREIALDYQRRFPHIVRVLYSERNVGPHANGSRCRAACRGEYVALCEGDDYWHHPSKLQMQVSAMEEPDVVLCHTDYDRLIGRRLKRSCHGSTHSPYLAEGYAYERLLHHWTVMTATAMYRADILREFEGSAFNNPAWPFGDYNKALFAAVRGRIRYLPVSTATWRKVSGSATNSDPARMLKMRLASLACREAFMRAYPVDESTRRECLAFANRGVASAAFHACDLQAFDAACARLGELGLPTSTGDALRRMALLWGWPARLHAMLRRSMLRLTADRF